MENPFELISHPKGWVYLHNPGANVHRPKHLLIHRARERNRLWSHDYCSVLLVRDDAWPESSRSPNVVSACACERSLLMWVTVWVCVSARVWAATSPVRQKKITALRFTALLELKALLSFALKKKIPRTFINKWKKNAQHTQTYTHTQTNNERNADLGKYSTTTRVFWLGDILSVYLWSSLYGTLEQRKIWKCSHRNICRTAFIHLASYLSTKQHGDRQLYTVLTKPGPQKTTAPHVKLCRNTLCTHLNPVWWVTIYQPVS